VHPYEIGSKNPSEDEHIYRTENKTAKTDPGKAGECLKKRMMKLYTFFTTKRKKTSQQTNNISYFSS